jgi:transcriptional regulator with XRE-family HTH domain
VVDGSRLQQARLRENLSQQGLGELIGKDQQYVSKLERGVLPGMTVETLERLADTLQCTTDYLLGRVACCGHENTE